MARRYTDEDKAEAVRLVRELRAELGTERGSVKPVADRLGFGVESVRTWVRQADADEPAPPAATPEVPSAPPVPPAHAAPARRPSRRAVVAGAVVVAVVVVVGILAWSARDTTTPEAGTTSPASGTSGTSTTSGAATSTTAGSASSDTTVTTSAVEPSGFGDGTYQVGSEVAPGRYQATEVESCYWERLAGLGGDFDDLIANRLVTGQAIVEVDPTDVAFSSSGCGRWEPYAPPATPATTFGPGDWAVNEQIVPGTYRSDASEGCYWERATAFLGDLEDIVTNGSPQGEALVEISGADARFSSTRCGSWTKVG